MFPGWCFMLSLIYGVPTMIFYMVILVKFHSQSTRSLFRGAFFKISTVLGIVDLLSYINSYPSLKMPLCVFFADLYLHATPGYWINISVFASYYLYYVRQYLLIANAGNRLTALVSPCKHNFVRF